MSPAQMVIGLLKLLSPALLSLEESGVAELNAIVSGIENELEREVLQSLIAALDKLAKTEIAKI